jgi:hypothetical protein
MTRNGHSQLEVVLDTSFQHAGLAEPAPDSVTCQIGRQRGADPLPADQAVV